jgi:hypothetical protein
MRIYFAHPTTDYGTAWKEDALHAIEAHFGDVVLVDPESDVHAEGYRAGGMAYFEGVVRTCDALVFARFPSARIGAGVAKEITTAEDAGIPTFELGRKLLRLVRVHPKADDLAWDYLDVPQTRRVIASLRSKVSA